MSSEIVKGTRDVNHVSSSHKGGIICDKEMSPRSFVKRICESEAKRPVPRGRLHQVTHNNNCRKIKYDKYSRTKSPPLPEESRGRYVILTEDRH